MAIVAEISWDDMLAGKSLPENPARTAWRQAVAEIAEKAKVTLPECHGRVDSAVKIVLAGDVELLEGTKAKVASQSNGTTKYFIVNGECNCKDYAKAPSNWCKHRIAAGIAKRAYTLAKQRLAQLDSPSNGTSQIPVEQSTTETLIPVTTQDTVATPLPEAPASANVYVNIGGRQVQVTLRDSDETRLLQRLETLLQRFPVVEDTKQEPREGWCYKHNAQMKHKTNEKGSWWFHKTSEGWCHGK